MLHPFNLQPGLVGVARWAHSAELLMAAHGVMTPSSSMIVRGGLSGAQNAFDDIGFFFPMFLGGPA